VSPVPRPEIEATPSVGRPASRRVAQISGRGHFTDKFRRQLGLPQRAELRPHRQRLCVVVDPAEVVPEIAAKHGFHMTVGEKFLWPGDDAPAGCAFAADMPTPMPPATGAAADNTLAAPEIPADPPRSAGIVSGGELVRLRLNALGLAVQSRFPGGETTSITTKRAKQFMAFIMAGDQTDD